jgi:hypothetical protein
MKSSQTSRAGVLVTLGEFGTTGRPDAQATDAPVNLETTRGPSGVPGAPSATTPGFRPGERVVAVALAGSGIRDEDVDIMPELQGAIVTCS